MKRNVTYCARHGSLSNSQHPILLSYSISAQRFAGFYEYVDN